MCVGIPMKVLEPRGRSARCAGRHGSGLIDLSLVGPQPAGTWVLTFMGYAKAVLDVEAVGFRIWEGNLCGVMVTPWFMSIVLVPVRPGAWSDWRPGDKIFWRLPSGRYEFVGGGGEGAGLYLSCSLFSPMAEFIDHETARAAANAAAEALFRADDDEGEDDARGRGIDRRMFLSAVATPGGLR